MINRFIFLFFFNYQILTNKQKFLNKLFKISESNSINYFYHIFDGKIYLKILKMNILAYNNKVKNVLSENEKNIDLKNVVSNFIQAINNKSKDYSD